MVIRPYEDADFDAVTSIWLASWDSTPASVPGAVSLDFLRQRLPQEIADGWKISVATSGDAVTGFLALQGNYLSQLWVAPEAQGKGIGSRMLAFVKGQLPRGFWLTTAAENISACRFYERAGLVRGEVGVHSRLGHVTVRYDWRP
ncbi:GNAT family N-acetyltransferase [Telmatospirillum sp.]|uniref:GNAT family N-acetyltransferase n=1 Tax=Telmatospirillum sp. TaxID=2079197 RepID=UPI00284CED97|nr:GNAT family N-acetyltransferase [Telmatospirillum sp.]MDR3438316.1 GNAT family N-acetyltransferase [Telmatospirillum sp.]